MSTPTAKRRRIEVASHTLSKPFRSPFKTPFKSPLKAHDESNLDSTVPTTIPNPLKSTATDATRLSHVPLPPTVPKKLNHASPCRINPSPSPRSTVTLNAEPDIAPLLRTQRDLEKQLREVKEQLDAAEQARKIETESAKKDVTGEIDGDLVEVITKWKSASRQAAEELFGQVRDRVNRMGGPRAWKEMQKRQQEFQSAWDQEEPRIEDPNDPDAGEDKEKRDSYLEYDVDVETENEKAQRFTDSKDTGELPGQEDEFTMAMMLKTLNVDLKVIGYDKEQQRWND